MVKSPIRTTFVIENKDILEEQKCELCKSKLSQKQKSLIMNSEFLLPKVISGWPDAITC